MTIFSQYFPKIKTNLKPSGSNLALLVTFQVFKILALFLEVQQNIFKRGTCAKGKSSLL